HAADASCGVRKIAPNGNISTLQNAFGTLGLGISPVKNNAQVLYASRGDTIVQVDRITGAATAFAGVAVTLTKHFQDGALDTSMFWNPHGIDTDSAGNVYVLDRLNSRVRVIYP